jgi:hypothetical protein
LAFTFKADDYNQVAAELLVPFDASLIKTRAQAGKNFSYVPPDQYRKRILEVFCNGYRLEVCPSSIVETDHGVRAAYTFGGTVDEVTYTISVPAYQEWTFKSGTYEAIQRDQAYNKLTSAALKAVCVNLGLGLHLYDKDEASSPVASGGGQTSAPRAASAPKASASTTPAGDWDGSALWSFGKYKNTAYNALDDADYLGYLQWAATKDKPDNGAVKECTRREALITNQAETESSGGSGLEDEEFEF